MTDKEIIARLAEIQVALLRDFGKPEGLSEASRRHAADLVAQLKTAIKNARTPKGAGFI